MGAINRLKNMLDQQMWRSAHNSISLNDTVKSGGDTDRDMFYEEIIPDNRTSIKDEGEFMIMVNAIKDKSLRAMFIVTGYLVCNLSFLEDEYNNILKSSDKEIQDNVAEMLKVVERGDEIDRLRIEGEVVKERKKKISVTDVISALKLNIIDIMNPKTGEITYQVESPTTTLKNIQDYIHTNLRLV